jgi:hypothetical protein
MTKDRVAVGKIESWISRGMLLWDVDMIFATPMDCFTMNASGTPGTPDADAGFRAVFHSRKIQQLLWISLAAKASKRIRFRPGPS